MRTRRTSWAVALACVGLGVAHAADQTILGSMLQLKNPSTAGGYPLYEKRKVVGKAKEPTSPNAIVGDPTLAGGGAVLTVTANGLNPSRQTFVLPQGTSMISGKTFWTGDAVKGFKYKDAKGENGPIKVAQIKKSGSGVFLLKASGSGKYSPITVRPPNPGTSGCVLLEITGGDSYSVSFAAGDGLVVNKGALEYTHKKPLLQETCVTTTSTSTTSSTSTSSTSTSSSTTTTTLRSGCFEDWGDETIRDTCTGLQWEKKSSPFVPGLHNVNDGYTWAGCCDGDCSTIERLCQPNAAAAATCAAQATAGTEGCGVCLSGTCNVNPEGFLGVSTTIWDWLSQVNESNFAGHSDWRLPSQEGRETGEATPRELNTILLAPYPCDVMPCIDPIFGRTAAGTHWSSTSSPYWGAENAWGVCFINGGDSLMTKSSANSVRAVRSGP